MGCVEHVRFHGKISSSFVLHAERSLVSYARNARFEAILEKNFATIALIYIVWTIFYAVIDQSQWFSDFSFLLSLKGWRKFAHSLASSHFHLWYLRALLVAYLLLPIIHAALHRGSVSLPYCLVVAVILVAPIFANEILAYGPSSIEEFVSKFPSSYLYYIAYMILGYALAKVSAETVSRKRKILLLLGYVAAAAIAILLNYHIALAAGKATTFLYGNFSIPVIMEACCLFLFLRLAGENVKPTKQLAALSRATLGVYVLHPFFISLLGRNEVSTDLFNAFISIPVLAIAVLAMSVCVTLLLERIPYVRKIV